MLHIAVVEDEVTEQARLKEYIDRFSGEMQVPIRVSTFSDGVGITSPYQAVYDIILLDIHLKIMDGLKAAELIRAKDEDVILIFITNLAQYALKGYAVNAFDFILKPVSYFAFSEELRQVLQKIEHRKNRFIPLKVEDGMIRLNLNDLYYAEMSNRKAVLHTRRGEYTVSGTMLKLEQLLDDPRFFRCHSGYLINIQYIYKIQTASVILEPGNIRLPLSRHKKKSLENSLMNYLQEQM